jgi:hypothetical protein
MFAFNANGLIYQYYPLQIVDIACLKLRIGGGNDQIGVFERLAFVVLYTFKVFLNLISCRLYLCLG